jgi:hypothetical protein
MLYEAGAGYYLPIKVNAKSDDYPFVFEVYGLLGAGRYRNFYWDTSGAAYAWDVEEFRYPDNLITSYFLKACVQPSISYTNNIVDVIISAQIGVIQTLKTKTTLPDTILASLSPPIQQAGNPYMTDLYTDWNFLNKYKTSFLFTPAVTLRLGWKYIKLQIQYSYTVPTNPFLRYNCSSNMASVGLSLNFAQIKRKTKKVACPSQK